MTQENDRTGDEGDVTNQRGANEPEEEEEYTGDANPAYDSDEDTLLEPTYDNDFTPWWQ